MSWSTNRGYSLQLDFYDASVIWKITISLKADKNIFLKYKITLRTSFYSLIYKSNFYEKVYCFK